MTVDIPQEIQDRIAAGRAKIAERQAKSAEAIATSRANEAAKRAVWLAQFQEEVLKHIPPALHPFVVWPDNATSFDLRAGQAGATMIVPGTERIHIITRGTSDGAPGSVRSCEYRTNILSALYDHPFDGRINGIGVDDYITFLDVDEALAAAAEQHARFLAWEDELHAAEEARTTEREQRRLQEEATQERIAAVNQMIQAAEDRERQELVDMLASDPVALALVKAFAAVATERAGYREAIDDAQPNYDF